MFGGGHLLLGRFGFVAFSRDKAYTTSHITKTTLPRNSPTNTVEQSERATRQARANARTGEAGEFHMMVLVLLLLGRVVVVKVVARWMCVFVADLRCCALVVSSKTFNVILNVDSTPCSNTTHRLTNFAFRVFVVVW